MSEQTTSAPEAQIREAIEGALAEHQIILFMKGTPDAPRCGFSAKTVGMLQALDARFAAVDILPDPRIREQLSAISNWPTIPQLFFEGELIGGCDIVTEMFETGELAHALGLEPAQAPAVTVEPTSGIQIENRLG
jgi:monothiol glutaredoxin